MSAVSFHHAAKNFPRRFRIREFFFTSVAPLQNFIKTFRGQANAGLHHQFAVFHIGRVVVVHQHRGSVSASGKAFHFHNGEKTVRSRFARFQVQRLAGVFQHAFRPAQMAAHVVAELQKKSSRRNVLVHRVES